VDRRLRNNLILPFHEDLSLSGQNTNGRAESGILFHLYNLYGNVMKNLKLVYKLTIGFGLVVAIIIALALQTNHALTLLEGNSLRQKDIYLASANEVKNVVTSFARARVKFVLFGTTGDDKAIQQGMQLLDTTNNNLHALISTIAKFPELSDLEATTDQLGMSLATYRKNYQLLKQGSDPGLHARTEQLGDAIIMQNDAMLKGAMDKLRQTAVQNFEIGATTRKFINISALIAVLLSMAICFFVAGLIKKPVILCADFANNLAHGDFTAHLNIQQKDEAGHLAGSMNNIVDNIGGMIKGISEGLGTLASSSTELSAIAEEVASGAEQTTGKSETVATAAEEMSANMNSVAAATEQATTNVSIVATATEELTDAISEIAKNTAKASSITGTAVADVQEASVRVGQLGQSADEIGKVTEAITDISDQTNLLALNATIEAARAGEAGKGFAVVANEIKELAKQTAEATREIRSRIEGIQDSTQGTVAQIGQISEVINEVNTIVTNIASAVEQQSATTSEIAANMNQATLGLQEVTENVAQSSAVSGEIAQDILEINQAALDISMSGTQVRESVVELSNLAEQLRYLSSDFRV